MFTSADTGQHSQTWTQDLVLRQKQQRVTVETGEHFTFNIIENKKTRLKKKKTSKNKCTEQRAY